jgi:hypothetical protein
MSSCAGQSGQLAFKNQCRAAGKALPKLLGLQRRDELARRVYFGCALFPFATAAITFE